MPRSVADSAAMPPALPEKNGKTFAINLMEHLVVPTFVLDAERRVLIWNRACERLTGVSHSEVIGTSEHWRAFYDAPRPCLADLVATDNQEAIDSLYTVHADTTEPSFGVHAENWCVMPRLGHRLYLAVDAGPIFDEAGKLIAVVETLRDMTDKKNVEDALYKLANQDFLTGLGNRHAFDDALAKEWRRAFRQETPLSLIMLDVDHFKAYNDTYGHLTGDNCLKAVGQVIAENLHRAGDVGARYGGEEFAVILPMTDAEGAAALAEQIRTQVQELAIPHSGSPEVGLVTVSAGTATLFPTSESNLESLIATADAALYQAKHGGRNRVVAG